jgi:hypothetical protein
MAPRSPPSRPGRSNKEEKVEEDKEGDDSVTLSPDAPPAEASVVATLPPAAGPGEEEEEEGSEDDDDGDNDEGSGCRRAALEAKDPTKDPNVTKDDADLPEPFVSCGALPNLACWWSAPRCVNFLS